MKKALIFVVLFWVLSAAPIFAQFGKDRPDIWNFQEECEWDKAVVKIIGKIRVVNPETLKTEVRSVGQGSGSVIGRCEDQEGVSEGWYNGWILTAAHVTADSDYSDIVFFDGKSSTFAKLERAWSENWVDEVGEDVSIIKAAIPDYVTPLSIAKTIPESYSYVHVFGFGADSSKVRHFKAQMAYCDDDSICILGYSTAGDSGGPILNESGEIVSVISRIAVCKRNNLLGEAVVSGPIYGSGLKFIKGTLGLVK